MGRTCFMLRVLCLIFQSVIFCGLALSIFGQGVPVATNLTFVFASVETGREMLTQRDEFIAAMTPLDRRARLQVDREVTEKALLKFISDSVQAWKPDETNRLATGLREVKGKLEKWALPVPKAIYLIKTSGAEEFNNLYTRQNAIIFPAGEIKNPPAALGYLLYHELFHVLSRNNPELRKAAYAVIGFERIDEITLPDDLLRRKVTNPDGVENGWSITVTNKGESLQAVPVLLATGDSFNPNEHGASPYDYFRLVAVTRVKGDWIPKLTDGHPQLLKHSEVGGWSTQIGKNTQYIIHPDEILADNFAQLMLGRTNVLTPRVLNDLAEVLRQHAAGKSLK